jgi:hypothetical protein
MHRLDDTNICQSLGPGGLGLSILQNAVAAEPANLHSTTQPLELVGVTGYQSDELAVALRVAKRRQDRCLGDMAKSDDGVADTPTMRVASVWRGVLSCHRSVEGWWVRPSRKCSKAGAATSGQLTAPVISALAVQSLADTDSSRPWRIRPLVAGIRPHRRWQRTAAGKGELRGNGAHCGAYGSHRAPWLTRAERSTAARS